MTDTETIDPARAFPVLASLAIAESRDFYRDRLGFTVSYEDETYLIVRRGSMEIHFWKAPERIFAENTSCYIRGGEIAALHAEFSSARVPGLSDFALRPWGLKEFHLHDPHGNLLRFGMIPEGT